MSQLPPDLPTPLVPAAWLAAHLGHPRLRILDASWYMPDSGRDAKAEHEAAHIPGAVFADLESLSDADAPHPHTRPAPAVLAARFSALGVGKGDAVVVYDGSATHFSAPRTWWMLRALGHTRVAVLDGGLPAWRRSGYATAHGREAPVPAATPLAPHPAADAWRDLEAMRTHVARHDVQVVDARSKSRFTAAEPEPRPGVRGGHMPGARHVHYASLSTPGGMLMDAAALRARFADAGVALDRPVVTTCGSGVTACTVALALVVAGAPSIAVYDGSWSEWGSRTDTPIVTGDD